MQLTEFGFDLLDSHGRHIRMPLQIRLESVAEGNQDPVPAGVAIDLVDRKVREKLGIPRSELLDRNFVWCLSG